MSNGVQNGGRWPKMGARKGPNATPTSSEKFQCRLELAKSTPGCVPGSPGPARARFCVRLWAPKAAPRGPKSEQKAVQKCVEKLFFLTSRFGIELYPFGGPSKNHFWGLKKDPSEGKDCKVHAYNVLGKPCKHQHFEVGAWGCFEQKRFKK